MMTTDPRLIRASDQDRDRTAQLLREHHAVGRLDADEFTERIDKVFLAKTIGDLDELTADLPAVDPYPLPTSSLARPHPGGGLPAASVLDAMSRGHGRFSPAWQAAWGSWLCTSLVLIVIWLLTGGGYPWPLWVIGIWGALLGGRWITGSHPEGYRRGRIRGGHIDRGQLGEGGDGSGNAQGGG
jgi:uncharacterized protein DUF1707